MTVRVERQGPVTTVVLARPRAANAVDRATALALADAFRAFDADDGALSAVLCGDGPSFCAGADLKAVAAGNPNRVDPEGDAPMGPSRMLLSKPVVAAIGGHAVAGGLELALELARFPQDCMRHDRLSAYEGLELPFDAAMRNEFEHGLASLRAGAAEGAARFAGGEGRHGAF